MKFKALLGLLLFCEIVFSQDTAKQILIQPDQVFDGKEMHAGWIVLVKGNLIAAVGDPKSISLPSNATRIVLKGTTLIPGLIEGHSHLFLHPYNETTWDDQVLKESRAERTARAVVHARETLMAGFTTVRDLGTEGAMYDDVGLKQAIEKRIIPGPRMIVATRAIVATNSYGPKVTNAESPTPKGAAEADGIDALTKEVRTQIGNGADVIKVYADYRWGLNKTAQPTFTLNELKLIVDITSGSGRMVVAHATTAEGMHRAALAGVSTIEHGDGATEEVFKLMKEKNVAYCPTLAATEAYSQYAGWKKGTGPEPAAVTEKKRAFQLALKSGVTICFGGDVGVFAHGDNARELELMKEYGMNDVDILKSATSVNATVFGYSNQLGSIRQGLLADLVAVQGDPSKNIHDIRNVKFVMKNGEIVRQ